MASYRNQCGACFEDFTSVNCSMPTEWASTPTTTRLNTQTAGAACASGKWSIWAGDVTPTAGGSIPFVLQMSGHGS